MGALGWGAVSWVLTETWLIAWREGDSLVRGKYPPGLEAPQLSAAPLCEAQLCGASAWLCTSAGGRAAALPPGTVSFQGPVHAQPGTEGFTSALRELRFEFAEVESSLSGPWFSICGFSFNSFFAFVCCYGFSVLWV